MQNLPNWKTEVRVKFLVYVVIHKSASGTTTNVFEVRLIVQLRMHLLIHLELSLKGVIQDLYKNAQKCAPENALKDAL